MQLLTKQNLKVITNFLESKKSKNTVTFCIDTETTGLDPHSNARLRLIQIYTEGLPCYYLDLFEQDKVFIFKVFEEFKKFLNIIWVGHNIKFDLKFLWKEGINITTKSNIIDTMILSQIIYNGFNYKHSLKECLKRELNLEVNKEEQTSNWGRKQLTQNQLNYAEKDVVVLANLKKRLFEKILRNGLGTIARIECDCVRVISALEYNGQYCNFDKWNALKPAYQKQKDVANDYIQNNVIVESVQMSLFANYKEDKVNIASSQEMLHQLKEKGVKLENTNAETLKTLDTKKLPKDVKKFIDVLLSFRDAEKALNTYINPLIGHKNASTERIHSNFFQLSAKSGRIACRTPNILTIPRDKKFRECFEGQGSNYYLDVDYSQLESRLSAWVAEDKNFIQLFRQGEDPYSAFAAKENGIDLKTFLSWKSDGEDLKESPDKYQDKSPKELQDINNNYKKYKQLRQSAKSAVLGLCFGMGAEKYKDYCKSTFGIEKSLNEAKASRDRFFKLFPKLSEWHKNCYAVYTHQEEKKVKSLRTINQRKLYGESIPYSLTINFGIQSLATDIIKQAQINIFDYLEKKYDLPLFDRAPIFQVAYVHDQVTFEGHLNILQEEKDVVSKFMVDSANKITKFGVPFKAEGKIGKNWADCH